MTAFAMRKGVTVTLTGANTTGQFRQGDLDVQPGKAIDAIRFKMRCTITNGGSGRTLTDAEKRTLLSGFDITLRHGRSGQFNPYSKMGLDVCRTLTRNGLASEWEGYTDATTGLGQTFGASSNVVLYPRIPLSAFYQEPAFNQLFRMGSVQAKSVTIDIRRLADALPSGFAFSGSVLFDIIPDESPARYEFYTPVPRYTEWSEANRIATTIPTGFPFLLLERTAAHASTTMTTVRLDCDQLRLYEQVTLGEVIGRYLDTKVYFPSEANVTDVATLLYAIPPGVALKDLPTGKLVFEQQTHSLATMALAWWGIEPMTESQVVDEVQNLANMAGTTINVVNAATVLGLDLPKNLRFALPWCVFRHGEKEFESFPGWVASPGGSVVQPSVPDSVAERARGLRAAHMAAGEHVKAEDIAQQVALALPGSSGPRGLRTGSPTLERIRPKM